jgi:adenylylsulfate kinase-like enzyme
MKTPSILWLTGQPGSGKTTISNFIKKINDKENVLGNNTVLIQIDGDDLRSLTSNVDYSKEGRIKNIKLSQSIAEFCQAKGFFVIVSLVAPYLDIREELKNRKTVLEVYLHTSEKRGKEDFFVKNYEKPINNFIDLDTTNKTVEECSNEILTIYRKMATVA